MPGIFAGLNHSLDIHACGRSRIPRSSSSSWRVLRQSSSQVPSTTTLRLLRRCSSNCSSDSFSQAYFRRGIGRQKIMTIRYLYGVTGCWWQQPPSLRGEPLFNGPRRLWVHFQPVGWAKAPLRRAHHLLSGFVLQMVGTLSLCPPYGRWTKRQSGQASKIAAITNSCRAARTPACADAARAGAAARTGRGQPWISIPSDQ